MEPDTQRIFPKGPTRVLRGIVSLLAIVLLAGSLWFWQSFRPLGGETGEVRFVVNLGEGLGVIATRLESAHLIRSAVALKIYAVLTGEDRGLQAGTYRLRRTVSAREILATLVHGRSPIVIKIPEGATVYEVDAILSSAGITEPGAVVMLAKGDEGRLFPDTYHLLPDTPAAEVVEILKDNFEAKLGPMLKTSSDATTTLILASLLEREVPDLNDRRIVAGIIEKRIAGKMRLQVDATVCYWKKMQAFAAGFRDYPFPSCYPLTAIDLAASSPYNTYSNNGLPPGPIGSPGVSAVQAALAPLASPYWFYLSDPKTKQTIFSRTFDEHRLNRARYLE